ncbi:MAG: class II aldolase/adducin family protein [Chloroflexota bacterium]
MWIRDGLVRELQRRGFEFKPDTLDDIDLVLNVTDMENPRTFRRKSQGTFAIAIVEVPGEPDDFIRACYPVLVRSLSQVALCLVDRGDQIDAHFLTMEQGHYVVSKTPDRSEQDFFSEIHDRIAPLATARYVINNRFDTDLPQELWNGDELTQQLIEAGKRLDSWNLLPAPWPIQDYLSERELRHVKRLFGIGGLSYGNLSVRKDEQTFWMSASGVNKGQLQEIGRDILLVKDFDPDEHAMVLSVPPDVEPRRVSVDAIEHFMIYREHPEVNAIVHVHAWMDNIKSTHINFPCGTQELAVAVADLVRQEPDPSRAVIGLKNHGLTLTGRSLEDIFERLEDRVIPQVPMS